MLGTHYAIVYTKRMGEQTIDIEGEDRKKRGESGHRAAANAWGDHDTGSKSQSGGNLGNGGKGKELLHRHVIS